MTCPQRVERSAPGKLFVAGEYAVVEPGAPAILVAVDRHVTVSAAGRPGPGVVISSDLGGRAVRWRWRAGLLEPYGEGDGQRARTRLAHVVAAIETVGLLLAARGLPRPALHLTVSSRLHERGRKFGLGSSGAVTVATVAAVAALSGLHLTPDARFRLALIASAGIDAHGSGGDLAASTWGGWIAYRAPDRALVLDLVRGAGIEEALRAPWPGFSVRRLPPPDSLSLQVGWTGSPASTTSLVASLHRRSWRGGASYRTFLDTSADIVHAALSALECGDGPALQHQIRRCARELGRLDEEAGLGIFTPALRELCAAAESAGAAAKPSGAGGGDCGIALLEAGAPHTLAQLHTRWAAAGITPLPVRPAIEGTPS
jgi:phosphomevalonate kinase